MNNKSKKTSAQKGLDKLFSLPEIDAKATQKRVEEVLETVRIYKQIGFVRREIKNTPSYDPRFHGSTNAISKPAEDVAVFNAEGEERLREMNDNVDRAVNRLSSKEREIIQKRYLQSDEREMDFRIYTEMHMSERSYRRVKSRAFYKLAFMLRLEVTVEEGA